MAALYSFDEGYHTSFLNDAERQGQAMRDARQRVGLLNRYATKGHLLDIGCSAGHFLAAAREDGWRTVGVELSEDTAGLARKQFGLDVVVGDVEDCDLPREAFDVITMWDVFEHFIDPIAKLRAIRKLLKPGGVALIFTPNIDGVFPRLSLPVGKIVGRWPHPEPPHHLFQFSKDSARFALERTGFEIRAIEDSRISLRYQIGDLKSLAWQPKRLLYWLTFAPLSFVGPLVRAGDQMLMVAKKPQLAPA